MGDEAVSPPPDLGQGIVGLVVEVEAPQLVLEADQDALDQVSLAGGHAPPGTGLVPVAQAVVLPDHELAQVGPVVVGRHGGGAPVEAQVGAPCPLPQLADVAERVVGPVLQLQSGGMEGPVQAESLPDGGAGGVEATEALFQPGRHGEAAVLGDVVLDLDVAPERHVVAGRVDGECLPPPGAGAPEQDGAGVSTIAWVMARPSSSRSASLRRALATRALSTPTSGPARSMPVTPTSVSRLRRSPRCDSLASAASRPPSGSLKAATKTRSTSSRQPPWSTTATTQNQRSQ